MLTIKLFILGMEHSMLHTIMPLVLVLLLLVKASLLKLLMVIIKLHLSQKQCRNMQKEPITMPLLQETILFVNLLLISK